MTKAGTSKAIFSLMLVLFIDGMGQGIIFPILTSTITNAHSSLLLHHATQPERNIWYGVLISVYFLMWFLGATVLGDWSDRVGRKKALVFCLILAAISFLLSAFAFMVGSLALLLVSRFIGGITSGDQAIAQAAVIDLCDPDKKPIYLGLVLLAVTLGLVVGPLMGAFLQNSNIVSWFSMQTPFYFAALIAVINIGLLFLFFKETHYVKKPGKVQWTKSIKMFIDAFRYKPIRLLLWSFTLMQTGWVMFYFYTPDYISVHFKISAASSGWFVALIGAGIGIGLGGLPSLVRTKNYKLISAIGYAAIMVASFIFMVAPNMMPLWISVIPATALFGLGIANIMPLFSEAISPERQGWIMGVFGSIVALTAGIDAAISGLLSSIHLFVPYLFAIVMIILGIIALFLYKHQHYSAE